MPVVKADEWDTFLEHSPDVHILQTSTWGALKEAFGWHAERVIVHNPGGDIGAQVLFRRVLRSFSIAYIPKGPVSLMGCSLEGKIWGQFLKEIDALCRKQRSILLKVEPDCWHLDQAGEINRSVSQKPEGFIEATHTIQPPRTIVVDISASEDEILSRMKQKTRYNIKLAQKKGVEVRASDDLEGFYRLMMTTGKRDAFGVHSLEYFKQAYEGFKTQNQVELFLAYYGGEPLAGLMVFRSGTRAWYFYGASSNERRELMPAYLLQWEAIRWAKAHGCTEYDLWGVPDVDEGKLETYFSERSDGLWGVYRFKRGFGGELRRAAGPWDRIYQPLLYQLYSWRTGKISDG